MELKLPDVCVPFDFDGTWLLLMEYQLQNKKNFQIFHSKTTTYKVIADFDS